MTTPKDTIPTIVHFSQAGWKPVFLIWNAAVMVPVREKIALKSHEVRLFIYRSVSRLSKEAMNAGRPNSTNTAQKGISQTLFR